MSYSLDPWDAGQRPKLKNGMNQPPPLPEDDFCGVHGGYFFTCWFSKRFFDVHDYKHGKEFKTPMHFYEYTCDKCGKKFTI